MMGVVRPGMATWKPSSRLKCEPATWFPAAPPADLDGFDFRWQVDKLRIAQCERAQR
jgi:hypothetical protein